MSVRLANHQVGAMCASFKLVAAYTLGPALIITDSTMSCTLTLALTAGFGNATANATSTGNSTSLSGLSMSDCMEGLSMFREGVESGGLPGGYSSDTLQQWCWQGMFEDLDTTEMYAQLLDLCCACNCSQRCGHSQALECTHAGMP
jgi:hypothetical protein